MKLATAKAGTVGLLIGYIDGNLALMTQDGVPVFGVTGINITANKREGLPEARIDVLLVAPVKRPPE